MSLWEEPRRHSQGSRRSSSNNNIFSGSQHQHHTQPNDPQQQQNQRPLFRPEWTDAVLEYLIEVVQFVTKHAPHFLEWLQELAQETWQNHPGLLIEFVVVHILLLLTSIDYIALILQGARNCPESWKRCCEAGVLLAVLRFGQTVLLPRYFQSCRPVPMKVAAVFGYGPGLGNALAQKWLQEGFKVAILSRSKEKVETAATTLGEHCQGFACDVTDNGDIQTAVTAITQQLGPIHTVLYNAGSGVFKPWQQVQAQEFQAGFATNVAGLLTVSQTVVPRMLSSQAYDSDDDNDETNSDINTNNPNNAKGCLLVTGATASLRGKPITTGFAPHKGAQRLLCQSLARDLHPKGIHVGYFIIDGGIGSDGNDTRDETKLSPASIAQTYWNVAVQDKSCWSFETEVRPSQETW